MGIPGKLKVAALSAFLALFAVTSMLATPVSALPSQVLYGCDGSQGDAPSTLYAIAPSTGAITKIGSMVNDIGCSALDIGPGGILYAGGIDAATGNVALFRVNTATGLATLVGDSNQGSCSDNPAGNNISDMAFSSTGTLYALFVTVGAGGPAGNPCLGTINTTTGAETDVGLTGMSEGGDAFAIGSNGVLYGADTNNLYTISKTTGAATVLAPFSGGVNGNGICSTTGLPPIPPVFPNGVPPLQPMGAMKFDDGGILYGVINCGRGLVNGDTFLVTVSLGGAISVVGEIPPGSGNVAVGIDGIAWGPATVTPPGVPQFPLGSISSLALVAAALPLLWMIRGRSVKVPA